MKICSKCKESKELEDFNLHKTKKDGHQDYCRTCDNERKRYYYKNNVIKFLGYNKKSISRNREFVLNYKKTHNCVDCGMSDYRCMDFHHLDPNMKLANISDIKMFSNSMKKLKEEIDKCVILCANCHRIRHHKKEYGAA